MNSNIKKSICLFCSLGCGTAFNTRKAEIFSIAYDKENPVNAGSLCPRGHYNIELATHPQRKSSPTYQGRDISELEAMRLIEENLSSVSGDEIAILVSTIESNETALAAAKLAKKYQTKNISAAGYDADLEIVQNYRIERSESASLQDLENSEALLIVGDVLTRTPVLSKRINKVKYGKRGNQVIVLDPNATHTSWFATSHLKCKPNSESAVLSGMLGQNLEEVEKLSGISKSAIENAAKSFSQAKSGVIIIVPSNGRERNDLLLFFASQIAGRSENKKILVLYQGGNTLGVNKIIDEEVCGHLSNKEIEKKLENKEIKLLISIGKSDISNASNAQFQLVFDYFCNENMASNTLYLPKTSQMETEGTYQLCDNRIESVYSISNAIGVVPRQILSKIIGTSESLSDLSSVCGTLLSKNIGKSAEDINQKTQLAIKLNIRDKVEIEPIVDFDGNDLVKRFFWYRSNSVK